MSTPNTRPTVVVWNRIMSWILSGGGPAGRFNRLAWLGWLVATLPGSADWSAAWAAANNARTKRVGLVFIGWLSLRQLFSSACGCQLASCLIPFRSNQEPFGV